GRPAKNGSSNGNLHTSDRVVPWKPPARRAYGARRNGKGGSPMKARLTVLLAAPAVALATSPAAAKEKEQVALASCEQSYGTIAVVDGDTQGWTEFGLGSPRELFHSLALQSGCFTPHNAASGRPA